MKNKIISYIFGLLVVAMFLLSLFLDDRKISYFERRTLQQFSNFDSSFLLKLDDYVTDQFPFRNMFLSIKSFFNRYILRIKDDNNVYIVDDVIYEKNYPLNEKSVQDFIKKMNYMQEKYLQKTTNYYAIIPDKAYFLDQSKYLTIDYTFLYKELNNGLKMNYINLLDTLIINDYYKSDIHIKQESMLKLVKLMSYDLGYNYYDYSYDKNEFNNFYGASYSKIGYSFKKESLVYLTNDYMEKVFVNHLEYGKKDLHDISMLKGIDAYNVFLSGPSAFIEINNNNMKEKKELVIFRDSFASSIAPLLIPYYSKITLIDLRYIDESMLSKYISFDNQEVLFLYSTLIVNNSSILKVNVIDNY